MLKSRFNLSSKIKEEEVKEDESKQENPKMKERKKPNLEEPKMEEELLAEELGDTVIEEVVESTYPERKLHKSEISIRLSLLGKTAEGDGYTYLKVACNGMQLTDITAIKSFQHLQFVDVSNNNLTLDRLQVVTELPFLILVHADKNALMSAALNHMKYLQVIIMNYNKITSVHDIYQPELSTLEVGFNKIQRVNFKHKMLTLKCLDFRYNIIQDISDFDFPNLDSLYLAGNRITSLIGIEKLVNLRILHVRNNPIKLLNGFNPELNKLIYLNIRNCKVATLKQVKRLRVLPTLETLVMKGCPYMGGTGVEDAEVGNEEEVPELRVEVLASLPRLKRINKGVITPEERTEAKDLMKQWLEEGENDEEEVNEEHSEEESNDD